MSFINFGNNMENHPIIKQSKYFEQNVIILHPTPEQREKIKEIFKKGETHARLHDKTDSNTVL